MVLSQSWRKLDDPPTASSYQQHGKSITSLMKFFSLPMSNRLSQLNRSPYHLLQRSSIMYLSMSLSESRKPRWSEDNSSTLSNGRVLPTKTTPGNQPSTSHTQTKSLRTSIAHTPTLQVLLVPLPLPAAYLFLVHSSRPTSLRNTHDRPSPLESTPSCRPNVSLLVTPVDTTAHCVRQASRLERGVM